MWYAIEAGDIAAWVMSYVLIAETRLFTMSFEKTAANWCSFYFALASVYDASSAMAYVTARNDAI